MKNKFISFKNIKTKSFQDNNTSKHSNNQYLEHRIPAYSIKAASIVVVLIIVIGTIATAITMQNGNNDQNPISEQKEKFSIGKAFGIISNENDDQYLISAQKVKFSIGKAFGIISNKNELDSNLTTEDFTRDVLAKYLKIEKECKDPKECDFAEKIKRPDGSIIQLKEMPTTMEDITYALSVNTEENTPGTYNNTTEDYNNAHFFITQSGIHVMYFYNPYCVNNTKERPFPEDKNAPNKKIERQLALDSVCFWGIYDMNGKKKPNQVGKDIGFVGSFYRGKDIKVASVLPTASKGIPTTKLEGDDDHFQRALDYCKRLDGGKYRLPNINELSLMFLSRKFITDDNTEQWYWTSTEITPSHMGLLDFSNGQRGWNVKTNTKSYVYCVKKILKNNK